MKFAARPNITISPPLFTTITNLDFNSDDDEDSDYNPFTGCQSEDDTTSEDDKDVECMSIPYPSKHTTQASRKFQQQIRLYNMKCAFKSPGAKLDNKYNNGFSSPTI
ncbi:hypothetical protein KIW84_057509 [Lathyrus oleraceus]|uniref:Uncharacterized protein n=1 Tax=Pisum sativum TaxID=3888 RepID=A0A9D4X3V2_PEA|nr:hypothetical protein KIW84_057509 [Pisum sativum]